MLGPTIIPLLTLRSYSFDYYLGFNNFHEIFNISQLIFFNLICILAPFFIYTLEYKNWVKQRLI
jgi:hypothetical protein